MSFTNEMLDSRLLSAPFSEIVSSMQQSSSLNRSTRTLTPTKFLPVVVLLVVLETTIEVSEWNRSFIWDVMPFVKET